MMKNNWIIGLPQGEREYKIGGVTYRVTSAFAPRSGAVIAPCVPISDKRSWPMDGLFRWRNFLKLHS